MNFLSDNHLYESVAALPKIDLHRHLEGSIRVETLIEVARLYQIDLPESDVETLRPHVQIVKGDPRTWREFLGKFRVLRRFFQSPEVIKHITREVVIDAADDNVKYLELRFTPHALSRHIDCTYYDVVSWVCETVRAVEATHDIQVGLILSMNRHEELQIGEEILRTALEFHDCGIAGLDLAGQEPGYPAEPFRKVFLKAKEANLGVTIHAGEWAGPENVRRAVEHLGADRIGHGVRSADDPDLIEFLIERGVLLEICPTSNIQSGVVSEMSRHPLVELFKHNVRTTINTDDPAISNITLTDEIVHVVENTTLTIEDIKQQILTAAAGAFLPEDERAALVNRFETLLASS
ncbi:MAG: adenosine deaminase [Phototrophicales bacterium]|nr:MAG: adenosine deaminase [Phototrophicales bacterium]